MITAYLTGDQSLLERLQALPGIVNAGLVRGITRLAIDLQRTLQQDSLDGQLRNRTRPPNSRAELRVEQSGGAITAKLCTARDRGLTGTANVRVTLLHKRGAFLSPAAKKVVGAPVGAPVLPQGSFLQSALDSMTPAVRDEAEGALEEAVSQ